MNKFIKLVLLSLFLFAAPLYSQYYSSNNSVYRQASGQPKFNVYRYDGPSYRWPHYPCIMCLGNKLLSMGYSQKTLNDATYRQWSILYDNYFNRHRKTTPQRTEPPKIKVKPKPKLDPEPKLETELQTEEDTKETVDVQPIVSVNDNIKKEDIVNETLYAPTPQLIVESILERAQIKAGDKLYDLGCGDGRFGIIAAKKYGVEVYAFDIQEEMVKLTNQLAKKEGVSDRVHVILADVLTIDMSKADIITMYFFEELNQKLILQFSRLKDGVKIFSYQHQIPNVKYNEEFKVQIGGVDHVYYLYVTPIKIVLSEGFL